MAPNYVALGYDWVNSDVDSMDDHGHGTHCAGIIAAVINNGIGVAGLAQVQIMAEKGLDYSGSGTADDLANAIIHAVDQGADILSNSWGGYFHSELIYEAVKYAHDRGVLVVAAAGNDAINVRHYPAGYDEVVAVTATDKNDNPAGFTNFGGWVELAAPGVDIYSTIWDNSYASKSGTSMACPHVAGLGALVWSVFANAERNWVRFWLRYTADDLGDLGFDIRYGYGRINARRSVEQTPAVHDVLISRCETPVYVDTGNQAVVSTTLVNFGLENETDITMQLLANGSVVDSTIIDSLAIRKSVAVNCSWIPTIEGIYNVTAYLVPVHSETVRENNVMSGYVLVGLRTVRVPATYPTIQEAIDEAGSGFTILVSAGTYYENVVVDKAVSLIGENRDTTIIDANGKWTVAAVETSNVSIINFTIRNSSDRYPHAGVDLYDVQGCNISNCHVTNNHWGINLLTSSNNTVSGNNITANNYHGIKLMWSSNSTVSRNNIAANGAYGIWLEKSSNYNSIDGNDVKNNRYGIVLETTSSNVVRNNIIADNSYNFGVFGYALSDFIHDMDDSNTVNGKPVLYFVNKKNLVIDSSTYPNIGYLALINSTNITIVGLELKKNNKQGILLAYTTNSQVTNNKMTNNYYGVRLDSSSNNIISGNNITNNSYGIYLQTSSNNNNVAGNNIAANSECGVRLDLSFNNTVSGNNITNCSFDGVYFFDSFSNTVSENSITNNRCGILLESSSNNKFYHNNVVNNANQVCVYSSGNVWDDGYPSGGNHWSDYTGVDEKSGPDQDQPGSDGIGDKPYIINEYDQDRYPFMEPFEAFHDIAVTNVASSKTVIGQGYNVSIEVTVENQSNSTENFDITVYANTTAIDTKPVTIKGCGSTNVAFVWNTAGFAKGNYTMIAYAWHVQGETDTADNTFIGGFVTVSIPGDVDGSGEVNIFDVVKITGIYASKRGDPQFNPNSDIDDDSVITILDVVICTSHYGQKDP